MKCILDRRGDESVFFHRGAIFKTMTSNREQGVAVFNEGARCFFFRVSTSVSDHMDYRGQE